MGHIPHLEALALVVGLGVVIALVLARLQLPTLAGLLVAGAVLGPFGFALVPEPAAISALAEVGVVLLLFSVGLEFSLARLRYIAKQVLIGGSLQVGLTLLGVLAVVLALGGTARSGVFLGFLFALSSTAIVLRALGERGEVDAPHGRLVVGVLIFQDLCVVPMMLLVPVLAGTQGAAAGGSVGTAVALALGKAALVVVLVLVVARRVVPRFLHWVDRSRSRELFLLAVLSVCITTAYVTSLVGLSLALGAFLGGMVLADTEHGTRALGQVLPLRDLFASVFFISVGMLFDVSVLVAQPLAVGVMFAGFVIAKGALATAAALAMRFPARVAWLAGVGLAQFGEFGFVLAAQGERVGLLRPELARPLLAAGALSMFITPLLVRVAPHVSAGERILRRLERLFGAQAIAEAAAEHAGLSGHVVIGGYGTGGRLLAQALADTGTPYVAIDLDVDRVGEARAAGDAVYYGDVTDPEALQEAQLSRARVLVLLVNDAEATRRAIAAAREVAPRIPILVRSQRQAEGELLRTVGAEDVVSERLEAALELMARVMRRVNLPGNVIADALRKARLQTGASARKATLPRARMGDVEALADLKIESVQLRPGAHAVGKSMAAIDLRRHTDALVVAVRRGQTPIAHPDPRAPLAAGDLLFLAGSGDAIRRAIEVLEAGRPEPDAAPLEN